MSAYGRIIPNYVTIPFTSIVRDELNRHWSVVVVLFQKMDAVIPLAIRIFYRPSFSVKIFLSTNQDDLERSVRLEPELFLLEMVARRKN